VNEGDAPGIHTKSEGTQTEQHAPKTHWRDPHLEGKRVFGIGNSGVCKAKNRVLQERLFKACGGG